MGEGWGGGGGGARMSLGLSSRIMFPDGIGMSQA